MHALRSYGALGPKLKISCGAALRQVMGILRPVVERSRCCATTPTARKIDSGVDANVRVEDTGALTLD
jgi:hypothetical protein